MKKKPNIILIMSDQQRLDTVHAYGQSICQTPNIDALAENGMKFNNAFTPSAICSPARSSVFTGLYPHNHGVIDNDTSLRDDQVTLADYLKEADYKMGYAGKWHVTENKVATEYGFEGKDFDGYAFPGSGVYDSLKFNARPKNSPNYYEEYLKDNEMVIPDVKETFIGNNPSNQSQEMYGLLDGPVESSIDYFIASEAERLIEQFNSEDDSFFLWMNFWGPHSPTIVPEPYFSMYDPADIEEYPGYRETFESKPYSHKLMEQFWGLTDYGWEGFANISAKYFGQCTLIDDMVGKVVEKLKAEGIFDDTIIIYTADHGDCLGAHKLIEKGAFMYDEIYRIPMIVHGLDQGVSDEFVYLHDLMPTITDLIGCDLKTEIDSKSIRPILNGQSFESRSEVYCEFERHFYFSNQRMVRNHDYQFTFNPSELCELYDLKADPYQLDNRINDPALTSIKDGLKDTLQSYMEKTGDPQLGWFKRSRGGI